MSTARNADDAHGGEHLRRARERAGMSRAELAARVATDPLDPKPWLDEAWITRVEAGIGVLDVRYDEWVVLHRSTRLPRPDWWEGGYEHDLGFAWSGHREPGPGEPSRRQYWARVKTVAEENDRPYRARRDPDQELRVLCELLDAYQVAYVLVGTAAAIGYGAAVETDDVDLVPRTDPDNLQRLCDALNVLGPRWFAESRPEGWRIDGGRLEPRHLPGDIAALSLVTRLGRIDLVLRPRGFEVGYAALEPGAVTRVDRGVPLRLAGLDDVIRSKELLDRPKDRDQLPGLRRLRDQLRERQGPDTGS